MTRLTWPLVGLFVVLFAGVVHVQRARPPLAGGGTGSGSTGSIPVSSSVVAASWSHDENQAPVLELLILLRGAPGWYASAGPGTNGYNYTTNNGRTINHTFATAGSVTVAIDSDSNVPVKKLTVVVNLVTLVDRELAPEEANVILVDGVDTPQPVVETLAIDPRQPGEGDAATRAIVSAPRLRVFLQCDAPLPATLFSDVPEPQRTAIRRYYETPQGLCRRLQ